MAEFTAQGCEKCVFDDDAFLREFRLSSGLPWRAFWAKPQFPPIAQLLSASGALKNLAPVLLPLGNEQGAELYYNIAVTPWCHVTPDLQVLDPFRERVDSSVVLGIRAKIDF